MCCAISHECSTKMVPCECCYALLDVEREVDGIVVCGRCGFLTLLQQQLRNQFVAPLPDLKALLVLQEPLDGSHS